jgi:hypothetical protein
MAPPKHSRSKRNLALEGTEAVRAVGIYEAEFREQFGLANVPSHPRNKPSG